MKKLTAILICVFSILAVRAQKTSAFTTNDYVHAVKMATDIMVNDVTSPVAASRYYAYITLASNETLSQYPGHSQQLGARLNGFKKISIADSIVQKSNASLAAVLSVLESASRFLPSGKMLLRSIDSIKAVALKRGVSSAKINATSIVVSGVLQEILSYANNDGFRKLSGMKRYTPGQGDEYWQPTSPGFMSAIEPNWSTLRPFLMDSASQFSIDSPDKYDTATSSAFYKSLKEVYLIGKNLSKEQTDIAMFWDCNPYALQQLGHLEFGLKKISPGGHWLGITGIACKKSKADIFKTAYVHTLVSIGLADAFIACWFNKYQTNRIRPETAIKRLIDRNWRPLLQTPPFPEFTSGHSVVSTTSSIILTSIFGEHFSYTDNSEEEFGLPARKYKSFSDAANEASVSRLYGGIHFRDAIDNGIKEGKLIGTHVVSKMKSEAVSSIK
jgi:hypothetical protein